MKRWSGAAHTVLRLASQSGKKEARYPHDFPVSKQDIAEMAARRSIRCRAYYCGRPRIWSKAVGRSHQVPHRLR